MQQSAAAVAAAGVSAGRPEFPFESQWPQAFDGQCAVTIGMGVGRVIDYHVWLSQLACVCMMRLSHQLDLNEVLTSAG